MQNIDYLSEKENNLISAFGTLIEIIGDLDLELVSITEIAS